MAARRIRAVVRGEVQGVFFRARTQEEGLRLGLSGWVRNQPDGSVETVAEGEADRIEQFCRWLHHGPPAARVIGVEIEEQSTKGERQRFEIRYN
jgi:acylphosphatase